MPGETAHGSRGLRDKRMDNAATGAAPADFPGHGRPPGGWLSNADAAAGEVAEIDPARTKARRAALEIAKATMLARHGLTADHSDDVGLLCEEIANDLDIGGAQRANLMAAAQLHDLGKVAVPREILDKPGPLDEREWSIVREHTPVGERILRSVPELTEVARIVRHSHEHWDGSGYPDGLRGEEIPLASRVVLCADAFHAVRSDRPYRRGRSAPAALAELRKHAGTQFDPRVVDALERAAGRVVRPSSAMFATARAALRSRRLIALLLALVVGSSAFAAIRGPLGGLMSDGELEDARASELGCDPATACDLVRFAPFPELFRIRGAPDRRAGADSGMRLAGSSAQGRDAGSPLGPYSRTRDTGGGQGFTRVLGIRVGGGSPQTPGRGNPPVHSAPQPEGQPSPRPDPSPAPAPKRIERPKPPPRSAPAPPPTKPKKGNGNAYGHDKRMQNPHPPKPPPGQVKEKQQSGGWQGGGDRDDDDGDDD